MPIKAIILLSFGFNNLNRWGFGLVRDGAPFDLLGFSPAPFMIVLGIVLGQAFVVWTRRRQEQGKTPLLALEVLNSPTEKAAAQVFPCVSAGVRRCGARGRVAGGPSDRPGH